MLVGLKSATDSHISSAEVLGEGHQGLDIIDKDIASPEGATTLIFALALLTLHLLLKVKLSTKTFQNPESPLSHNSNGSTYCIASFHHHPIALTYFTHHHTQLLTLSW